MSVLSLLNSIMESLGLPVETGIFSGVPPDEYVVLTPLTDDFPLYGDDIPLAEVSEVRVSLFSKSNYTKRKNQITKALLSADFIITSRRYIGFENETSYHHFVTDVMKNYELEE